MLTGIDHIVIAVKNLEQASKDFGSAGFTVTPGGSHPTGTHNALIPFADGSYLELIAIENESLARDHPWFKQMGGKEGFITFAIGADPLDYELERLASLAISAVDRKDGARLRPDGQQLQWQSATLQSDPATCLPFLIQDVTDRALRVPSGPETAHRNGVTGITGVTIVVADSNAVMHIYGQIFGAPISALDHGYEGVQQSWRCFVHEHWIDLIQPQNDTLPLADYHQRFGDSLYQIFLSDGTGPEFPADRISIPNLPDVHILTMD